MFRFAAREDNRASNKNVRSQFALSAIVAIFVAFATQAARATISLTPDAITAGFKLTTFATGFPQGTSENVGPLGIAFPTTGGVLVSDAPGNVRLFPVDVDGQAAASAPVGQNYQLSNATGLVSVGSKIYMSRQSLGDLVEVNADGTFKQNIVNGMPFATGVIANPVNGHVFVTTLGVGHVYEVDPVAKTKTVFTNVNADGLTISPDGSTVYAVGTNGHIYGYSTTTKAQVFDSGFIDGDVDGAALGAGKLAGKLFANTNDGTIVQVDMSTKAQFLVAKNLVNDGSSRGDFVTIDPNGTLLLTQSSSIVRLSFEGGGFVTTPLPAGVWAGGLTALGGVFYGRRRNAANANAK